MRRSDRAAIDRLMDAVYGSTQAPLARERWDWLFGGYPAEAPLRYLVADAGEHLAGQLVGVPVRLQHQGEEVLGLLVVDMATDPGNRRQGVFSALAQELYAGSTGEAPVVLGFPNPSAAPIHYGWFDWVELRPFPLLIRPLGSFREALRAGGSRLAPAGAMLDMLNRPVRGLERVLRLADSRGGADIQPLEGFSGWADELWRELSPGLGTCAVRDAKYLDWRFCKCPYPYRRYALHREGAPVGFAVTRSSSTRFGKLWHVMELMAPKDDRAGARLLLTHALIDATRDGASAICAIATHRHPHRRALFGAGLLPAPRRLTQELSFGVRRNGDGVNVNALFHIDDWYLSGADLDSL